MFKLVVTNGEGEGRRGKMEAGDKEVQTTMHKINKLQGYIIHHREYSQCFYKNYKWSITFKSHESLYCTLVTYNIVHQLYFN